MQYKLDTKIEELELAPKLETRLKLCKAETFADVMAINAAEWANVTPKVVNALRRFQSANRQLYISLGGKPVQRNNEGRSRRRGGQDEQRFFVANNILNAYASAGMLFGGTRPVEEVMAEIVNAADAFMEAFTATNEAPAPEVVETPNTDAVDTIDTIDTIDSVDSVDIIDANDQLAKGDVITLTEYKGERKVPSKVLSVGCRVEVLSTADVDGALTIRGRVDGKDVKFKAKQWAWERAE